MKNGFVKTSPVFFRLIVRSMLLLVFVLALMALFIQAPLHLPADSSVTPNPAKSAWFLLWIQELVSWSRFMAWPIAAGSMFFMLLPWMPLQVRNHHAVWFPRGQKWVSILVLSLFVMIIALTLLAKFGRGPGWRLLF